MQDRPVVLYDANVLYPAQLRDFLMREARAAAALLRANFEAEGSSSSGRWSGTSTRARTPTSTLR